MRHLLRSASIVVTVLATASLAMATAAPAAVVAPARGVETAVKSAQGPPKITGKACRSADGVTVVVDFRILRDGKGKKMNRIKIGCAEGDQESGFSALLDAGFDVDPDSPFVCSIDNRPINPPRCPPPDGYWAYSHGQRGGDWAVSGTGAGGWVPPPGSLEGWCWAPYDKPGWKFRRLDPSDLFPPGSGNDRHATDHSGPAAQALQVPNTSSVWLTSVKP